MLQLRGDAFSKIVNALLIAQLLLPSFSVCSAGAAAIKKRATTAAHDPDIVGQTAAAAVTAADVVPKTESETVTKLLPQGSGVGGVQQQETATMSNGSMLLHKVQEKSAVISVEDEHSESIAGRSKNSLELPQATESPSVQSARLFGVAAHNKVSDAAVDNSINDGLDSAALEQQYSADSLGLDDERAQEIGNNDLTTEGILPEIEQVAAHVVRQNESTVALHPPNEVDFDKVQPQARAEELDEEFARANVGEAVTTTTEMSNVAQENVTAAVEGGSTGGNNATMLPQSAVSDNNNSTDKLPTTTTATTLSKLDVNTASKAHTHFSEESNEIHVNAGSAEKRAKFISDNATNAQQLQLPDAAEVWTLAAMKTLPKTNASMTTTLAPPEVRQAEQQQLEQTEQPLNGNSEKNLLDWTQIMMSGELLAKQNDNFLQYSTTMTPMTTQRKGAAPDEMPQLFENRTEAMLQANADATDESVEPLTKQTMQATAVNGQPLPKDQVNEIRVESTAEHWQPTSTAAPAAVATPYSTAHQTATSLAAAAVAATAAMASSTEAILSQAADKGDNNAISNATAATSETETAERAVEQRSAAMYESATTVLPTATEASMTTAAATPVATLEHAPLPETSNTTTVSNSPTTISHTTAATAPPPAFSSSPAYNETLLQVKTNYDDASSDAAANASAAHDDTQPALFPSATTTVSTLATGEVNASTISNASPPPEHAGARHETVAELGITDTTTTTASTTVLPDFLASSTTTVSNIPEQQLTATTTTTEVPIQTADKVNLLLARSELEQNLATSTIPTLLKLADETAATAATETLGIETTTTSAINELLIPQRSENNNTQAGATVTLTAEQTTLKPVVESTTTITKATPTTGSTSSTTATTPVFLTTTAAQTTTTTSTQAPPVSLAPTLVKPTAAVKGQLSHESEASIETNDIDPLDKKQPTTPSSTNATEQPAHETDLPLREEHQANTLAEELQPNNEHMLLPQTTTTMGSSELNITTTTTTEAPTTTTSHASTTTTEPPLISLLDDSTTTTSTPASISTKLEDIYAVFSSTQGVPLATSITPEPATTTTTEAVDIAPTTALPTQIVLSTAVPSITTMLPPLQASIGGGASPGMPVMPSGNLQPNSADASETDVNVIIAISVSVIGVVALILLVAFLYLMRKRQKQMSYGQRCRPVSLDAYSLDNVSVLGSVRRKGALRASKRSYGNVAFDDPSLRHNVLTAVELAKFVERRTSIFEEFRDVPQIHARADEVPPGCEDKNRYANVIPLPETRVILQQQNDDEKTEYINANYVRGPKDTPNYYIGCQAPLESTAADFWRMIWEQQSRVIIQATDLIENGIEKCADYLPPSVTLDNHTTYGDFQVTLKHREVKDRYAISTVMLKNTVADASRELTHYWYKWPEMGVPSEEAPIIAMLLEARSSLKSYAVEQTNELKEKSSSLTLKADDVSVVQVTPVNGSADADNKEPASVPVSSSNGEINGNVSPEKLKVATKSQGPLTVHCSPGTGRTGTIIACDMAIRSLETPKRSVDIPQIVYYVRRGRASAVQTKEQYEFIYKVANMYATKITNISHDN